MGNRKNKILKFTLVTTSVIIALVIICTIALMAIWHNEIATLISFEHIKERNDAIYDGSVYEMHVKGGYYFDEFLAQGGAKNDGDLSNFITSKMTKGLLDMNISQSDIACSAFTAVTTEGDRLFCRNYDFNKSNTCIVYTNPGGGRYASVSTVDLQFVGIDADSDVETFSEKICCLAAPYVPLDGVNEKGVSCGIFMSFQGKETTPTNQNTAKPDLTSTTLLRMILDYASNVDEAVKIASKYDLHDSANTSYHYMVADSTGKSAVLEWISGTDETDHDGSKRELMVIYNDSDDYIGTIEGESDYQWISNFINTPGYYNNDNDKKGFDRYMRIYADLSATNAVLKDEAHAMRILANVGRRSWPENNEICTIHSVVYNMTDKTALWVPNEHYYDSNSNYVLTCPKTK